MKPKRIEILGVPLDCVTMQSAVECIDEVIKKKCFTAVFAVNPEKVIKCLDNKAFLDTICSAGLLIPDGIGVVLAARLYGERDISQVTGAGLMPELCKLAEKRGYTVFFYGATPEVNMMTVNKIVTIYPDIQVVGSQHGYLAEDEMDDFVGNLKRISPDIVFVALGSPKQEQWIVEYLPDTGVRICQGVGGTFDVISGTVRRAPDFIQAIHLEWLYRLLANPGRLIRQTALPRFAWKVLISLFYRKAGAAKR